VDGGRLRLAQGVANACGAQRELVIELERGEVLRMQSLMADLPVADVSRLSWVHSTSHTSAAWVHCMPTFSTACEDNLFSGAVAAYSGAPLPCYTQFAGRSIVVAAPASRTQAGYTTEIVDPHGMVLAVPLRGRLTRLHHHIVWRLFDLIARAQTDAFHGAVREPAHVLGAQSTDGTGFHAVIPDILVHYGEDMLLDVKVMSLSRSFYTVGGLGRGCTGQVARTAGRILEQRAQTEHASYLRLARSVDQHAGVAAGVVGPVENRLLHDFGVLRPEGRCRRPRGQHTTPVWMLVVGPFANVSDDVEGLLDIVAWEMCRAACKGLADDVVSEHLSVAKSSVRREVGMMLARETARMHLDMAGELAAGRVQDVLEGGMQAIGGMGVGDYFDDLGGAIVVGAQ